MLFHRENLNSLHQGSLLLVQFTLLSTPAHNDCLQNFIKVGSAIRSLIQLIALYVYRLCLLHIHLLANFKILEMLGAPL